MKVPSTPKRPGCVKCVACIVAAPEPLRSELRPLPRGRLLERLKAVPSRAATATRSSAARLLALRSLARRIEQLTLEERKLETAN